MAKSANLARSFDPGQVRFFGISGDGQDVCVDFVKLSFGIIEGNDLGGTHVCEVLGVEEEDNILALVAVKRQG